MGDYTTQLYGEYFINRKLRIPSFKENMSCKVRGFFVVAHVVFNLWYPGSSVYVFLGKGGCEGVGKERWRWKTNDQ